MAMALWQLKPHVKTPQQKYLYAEAEHAEKLLVQYLDLKEFLDGMIHHTGQLCTDLFFSESLEIQLRAQLRMALDLLETAIKKGN